jgi:hypothetical protein
MNEFSSQGFDENDWKYIKQVPFSLALREIHRLKAFLFFFKNKKVEFTLYCAPKGGARD